MSKNVYDFIIENEKEKFITSLNKSFYDSIRNSSNNQDWSDATERLVSSHKEMVDGMMERHYQNIGHVLSNYINKKAGSDAGKYDPENTGYKLIEGCRSFYQKNQIFEAHAKQYLYELDRLAKVAEKSKSVSVLVGLLSKHQSSNFQKLNAESKEAIDTFRQEASDCDESALVIRVLNHIEYDNPVLNHPELLEKLSNKFGSNVVEKLINFGMEFSITGEDRSLLNDVCSNQDSMDSISMILGLDSENTTHPYNSY